MTLLNIIWPFLYDENELLILFLFILATILIEAIAINQLVKYDFKSALKLSALVNVVSGLLGTLIIPIIVFSIMRSNIESDYIRNNNELIWIWVFVITFVLSVIIEFIIAAVLRKKRLKIILFAFIIGNLITYSIGWNMHRINMIEFQESIKKNK